MTIFDVHTWLGGSVIPGIANNTNAIQYAMKERGIDGAILLAAHARSIDPVSGNRILKAMIDQAPNLYGCLITHVNRVESSIATMRELMPSPKFLGMALVGPNPEEPPSRLLADEIINSYRRFSKPLFLITPSAAHMHVALSIAKDFPMLKIVCLGMGGPDWRTAIAAAHSSTNIYLETSGTLDRSKLPAAIEVTGSHRLLFGSGAPHMDAAAAIGLVEDSDISPEVRKLIFYTNARKLFDLSL